MNSIELIVNHIIMRKSTLCSVHDKADGELIFIAE